MLAAKMECWCVSKIKSWLLILMMIILILIVCQIEGSCIEEERKALLEIKTSLLHSSPVPYVGPPPLMSWVDDDGECCEWERVKCNTTTGHVTDLSLSNMRNMVNQGCKGINWPLNVSLFLHFKEVTSLNLSKNCLDLGSGNTTSLNLSKNWLDYGIINTGLGKLSGLKKLEILDLSSNFISNEIFPSLGALTSLRVLDLSDNYELKGYFPDLALENLEILDLSGNFGMKGFQQVSLLKKLKILNLADNDFNESLLTSLSALPMLKSLDLRSNNVAGSFPAEELVHLTNLEELDLSWNYLDAARSIQECTRLSRLKRLKSITLGHNNFNKSILFCLSAFSSLKRLDLSYSSWEGSFPIQEMSHLPRDLEVLILSASDVDGTLPIQALASIFHNLQVLDLSGNQFVGSIPSTIQSLSSLRAVSFSNNMLNGSLPHGLCELKNLRELDLSHNRFDGSLPQCFNCLSSLKLLDISSNRFTGMLQPSLIANLTSLEYVDFGDNAFEGSFLFSSFANITKLEVVRFVSNNNKFEVETEEPIGWIPMFQLQFLVLSGCNINRPKGSVVPKFLLHQHLLQIIDLSENSLVGQFPNWLIENNTMLRALFLRKNSFSGVIRMPLHMNANTGWLDVSENHMNGIIPDDIQKFLPCITYLNLSSNSLDGVIPPSIGDLSLLEGLDLSDNELSGEVPKGLFTNIPSLRLLKLSKNKLHGKVLSGNLSLGNIESLQLDSNRFTGKIGNGTNEQLEILDISNNYFTGTIPHWISNMRDRSELVLSNNSLGGQFPCGGSFSFLDISHNSFSGPIPSCLDFHFMEHLYLGSNRFTGSIPNSFRDLTSVLALDIGNNFLSGRIPEFIGEPSNLKILILRNNNFSGSIPMQLCQLSDMGLIDLSSNSLSGSIPRCLQNITTLIYPTFIRGYRWSRSLYPSYNYHSVVQKMYGTFSNGMTTIGTQDEVQFTTKTLSLAYKGGVLDLMVGLDLSCNKLTGEIPKELGLLTQIHSLNLSHNRLCGSIPMHFSNLTNIESLDLSSNNLSGEIPSQLIQLNYVAVFNVSYNNLSGGLPEMKAQFGTFTKESYEGNPLLCGPPLEKKCATTSQQAHTPTKEGKWYDIDMTSFYGSSGSTWVVFLLGFAAVIYINPYWRRRWLDFVEECMYTCYYFLDDSVRKLSMLFRK